MWLRGFNVSQKKSLRVFYSWQSSRDATVNRYFIKDAIQLAAKNLEKDISLSESILVDHDTKGVSGTPDITSTIFSKIDNADIFIADLTFVDDHKNFNPNVLIELGYALSSLGSDRVILVMNDHFGSATEESMPFNLRHKRFPISYTLAVKSDKPKVKPLLVKDLQQALKPLLTPRVAEVINITACPSLKEIFDFILTTDSKQNWHRHNSGFIDTIINKQNPNLRLEIDYNNGVQNQNYVEGWANRHPNSNATSYWLDLYYGNTLIDRFIVVSVDGGRATLPQPDISSDCSGVGNTVSRFSYKLAQLFDNLSALDQYLQRSGLSVGDYDYPRIGGYP